MAGRSTAITGASCKMIAGRRASCGEKTPCSLFDRAGYGFSQLWRTPMPDFPPHGQISTVLPRLCGEEGCGMRGN